MSNKKPILTDAQAEVLRLLSLGKTPAAVAKHLRVTVSCVHFHSLRMRKKLKVRTTAQLIIRYLGGMR